MHDIQNELPQIRPAPEEKNSRILNELFFRDNQFPLARVVDERPRLVVKRHSAKEVLDQVWLPAHPHHVHPTRPRQKLDGAQRRRDADAARHADHAFGLGGAAERRRVRSVHPARLGGRHGHGAVKRSGPVAQLRDTHTAVVLERRMRVERERVPLRLAQPREAQVHIITSVIDESPRMLEDDLHRGLTQRCHHQRRAVKCADEVSHEPVAQIEEDAGAHDPEDVGGGGVKHDGESPHRRQIVHRLASLVRDGFLQPLEHHRIRNERRANQRYQAGHARTMPPQELDVPADAPPHNVPERVPHDLHGHEGARERVQVMQVVDGKPLAEVRAMQRASQVMTL